MSIDKKIEKDDGVFTPDISKELFSGASNSLAVLYLKDSLEKGRNISIPSLGITIYAKDYNSEIYDR
ncbi:MAG: hypothetical protein ABIF18_03325 [archaeon]